MKVKVQLKGLIFTLLLYLLLNGSGDVRAQADAYTAAADYSAQHRGDAVLVYVGGELVFEQYQNNYNADDPHVLYSGTKSFSCALAVAAAEDGLLTLDQPAADTLTEWQGDALREQITVRHLLNLTSGLDPANGGLYSLRTRDKAAYAVNEVPMNYAPGERFQYGPSNYYAFGELLLRKLGGESVLEYAQRRIFDPIGLTVGEWRTDRVGNPDLASGARLTATEWAKYGLLILNNGAWNGEQVLDADLLTECFIGTAANPYYGLTFWLLYGDESTDVVRATINATGDAPEIPSGVTLGETAPRVVFAGGANNQRLYIIPELGMVVVRFGRADQRWDDSEFLRLLTEDML